MVSERTEEQKVTRAPLMVVLGGKECEIPILVASQSRPWRLKVAPFQAALGKYANMSTDDPEKAEEVFNYLLGARVDETIDFFFEYASNLNRKEIEAIATERELVNAFNAVVKVAFPFGE